MGHRAVGTAADEVLGVPVGAAKVTALHAVQYQLGGGDNEVGVQRDLGFEPETDRQSVVYGEVLRAFEGLVEFRRRRIEAASYAVPGTLWVVVLLGATLSIFASYVFNIQSFLVHGLMTTLLTSMIALLVFFIAATDHPYRGANAIEPRAYRFVLHAMTEYDGLADI